MTTYRHVLYNVQQRVAYLTLNRAEKLNALDPILIAELTHAVKTAEADGQVKVIVINANGTHFSIGQDPNHLMALQQASMEDNLADSHHLGNLLLSIYRCAKICIAQVEGHAIAGGVGLITACDFAFAVPSARLGYTEVRIGFVPAISMIFLLRKIGETRTKELLLSGQLISAVKAETYNLISRVVPNEDIRKEVYRFAQQLCLQNSASAMQLTKKMIADIQDFPMEHAIQFAAKMNAHIRATPDFQRGIAAFLNDKFINW